MLRHYFKYRRYSLSIALFTAVIFGVFSRLIGCDWIKLLFPLGVWVFSLLIITAIDYSLFCKRHDELYDAAQQENPELPEPKTLFDEDYLAIMQIYLKQLDSEAERRENEKKEILRFFLLWAKSSADAQLELGDDMQLKSLKSNHDIDLCRHYVYTQLDFFSFKNECCSIDELVREIVTRLNPVSFSKKIGIGMKRIGLSVFSDNRALHCLLEELILSALLRTEKGGVKIYSEKADVPTLIIEDTSAGMSAERLDTLFDKGNDINLFALKCVADELSIELEAESVEGKGFAMILRFPESA